MGMVVRAYMHMRACVCVCVCVCVCKITWRSYSILQYEMRMSVHALSFVRSHNRQCPLVSTL